MTSVTQSTGMLTREQLFHLFDRFIFLTSKPVSKSLHFGKLWYLYADVKKRVAEAVQDKQEAVAVTTAIQEEIFLEMGVGIEEVACDEAELGEEEFAEKMLNQQKLQEQQLEMLKYMRKFHLEDQSAILEKLHQQIRNGTYESGTSMLSAEQIDEIVPRKASPQYTPR
ncbi:hypothetical protein JHK84_044603 [Glycine max]|nr:hypothetical protein JHK86_044493 [Glycine max]KAG5107696.1 hypothetical protein JHK84_044603 [Glycine max]